MNSQHTLETFTTLLQGVTNIGQALQTQGETIQSHQTILTRIYNKMEATTTIFYELLNNTVLDNSDNVFNMTFLEFLERYRNADLEYLSTLYNPLDPNPYAIALVHLRECSDVALNGGSPPHFFNDLEGVTLSTNQHYIYNNHLTTLFKTLEGITESLELYKEFELFKVSVETYQVAYETLNDPVKLSAFIEEQSKARSLSALDVETSLNVNPNLKPHIQRYVELYGWPENFIFDSEKMANILINLGIV
tara:strand:- start:70 stop:816 length:747 start_codon:yes stop_codon:yes gene_type:complete